MLHGYDDISPLATAKQIEIIEEARKREFESKNKINDIPLENSNQTRKRLENKIYSNNDEVTISENTKNVKLNINTNHLNEKANIQESIITINLNFDDIINSILHLAKTYKEFYALNIFFLVWFLLVSIEFTFGYMESLSNVISDSFFNFFKIFAFLISGAAIYFNRYFNYRYKLVNERFEILAALSNLVFLMIVSIIMFISSLHLMTEDNQKDQLHSSNEFGQDQEQYTISVFKFFYLIKVILDISALMAFGDYIIHPILQIKINLMKKYKKWIKDLNELSLDEFQENSLIIKKWNNHYENMNCMIINISSDLISSLAFLICFNFSNGNHFEYIYFFISCLNLVVVFFLVNFVFGSIMHLLMEARNPITNVIDKILQREISLFEGCIGIKEVKYWMIANNNIKCK